MSTSSKPPNTGRRERRTDSRLATRLRAVIDSVEHGTLTFTAKGFSRTGAFLERGDPNLALPPVGSTIGVVFHWPLETHMAPVRVEATVIHHAPDGIGIKFEIA